MKYLIFTGRFGMGHICAAAAIKEELARICPDAEIITLDFFDCILPSLSHAIYSGFNFTVNKLSGVYNLLNVVTGKNSFVPMKQLIAKHVGEIIEGCCPNMIISTLPVSSQYVSAYKEKSASDIPLYTYITDIEAHTDWIAPATDRYFVGAPETAAALIRRGVAAERIILSGIPVRREFTEKAEDTTAVPTTFRLLIMGGGLGMLPCPDELLRGLGETKNVSVRVITGKNRRLYNRLYGKYPGVEVIGFSDRIAEYMHEADLIITKSGGITTFEAIHTGTPLFIIKPFLQQEIGNAEYIRSQGIGFIHDTREIEAADILRALCNRRRLSRMRENMGQLCSALAPLCPAECYPVREAAS